MNKLTDMPNIGPNCAEKLKEVGIETPEQLINVGSKEAFLKVRTIDSGACLHMLYALEGAVQNVPKQNLSIEEKKRLKEFFDNLR